MKQFLKNIHKALLGFFILAVLFLNIKLYHRPDFREHYNVDVYRQLSWLKEKMHNGSAYEMQELFPEGFVFLNALYALGWCDEISTQTSDGSIYLEGLKEINWSLNELESAEGRKVFPKELPLSYGVFYQGWRTYSLAKKLEIEIRNGFVDTLEVLRFQHLCKTIHAAYENSNSIYLESYYGQSWPADNTIALACLALHDKLFEPQYHAFISDWLKKVKLHLDPKTGLIPHAVNSRTNTVLTGARGSSQSLMNVFLPEIDTAFAKQQFEIYRSVFLDFRLGLPGIREYPPGQVSGMGDIDSGPVIWGIGGSASIVGIRTMAVHKDLELHAGLRNSVEGFGVPLTFGGKKRYLLGSLPMADAFIAWSNAIIITSSTSTSSTRWRWRFQLVSGLVILVFVWIIIKW
ncbi:MAG: hypothetical protein KDC85_22615 [Saprospiraceae bacterium]|nr:hypothetical protein [Saprospiraceae bacterium]MCB9323598.1 hypothetical protein [Lewinellaceae bacterium]